MKPGREQKREAAPETSGFRSFFRIWRDRVWDLVSVSMVYSAFCLLLVPCGLAGVGMTAVARNLTRGLPMDWVQDFFGAIRKNWKQALGMGLLNVCVLGLLGFLTVFYLTVQGTTAVVGLVFCVSALVIFSFMKYYLWLLMLSFDLPLGKLLRNAFLFAFLNFKTNWMLGAISAAYWMLAGVLFLYVPLSAVRVVVLAVTVCAFPGFKHLLVQYFVFPCVKEKMIDPYYAEHPEADRELRQSLGLMEEEQEPCPHKR